MSSALRPQGCPTSDELSASVDGSTPEEIAVHLDSCSACQRQLAILRRIDGAVRQSLTPPTGLSERIRAAVRDSAQQAEPVPVVHWWFSPVLRLAAAVVATAAALAVLVHVLGGPARPGGRGDQGTAIAGPDQAPAMAQPAEPRAPELPLGPDNTKLAGVNRSAPAATATDGGAPQALPADVKHVWVVANLANETSRLKGLVGPAACRFSKEGGNTVVTVDLDDNALQELVDRLHQRKWQLVTPELPQPQQRGTVAFNGQNVRYRMVLVEQR